MLGKLRDKACRSTATALIHTHIERAISEKTEPALRMIQLSRRHTEIEDHAVNLRDANRPQVLLERTEIPLDQAQA